MNARNDKTDKGYRFLEALNALEALDNFINGNLEQGKQKYIDSGPYARKMFIYIATKQSSDVTKMLIEEILPYASENIDWNSTYCIKAKGVTAGDVFNELVKPTLAQYKDENTVDSSNNNLNNTAELVEEITELKQAEQRKYILSNEKEEQVAQLLKKEELDRHVKSAIEDICRDIDNPYNDDIYNLINKFSELDDIELLAALCHSIPHD